MIDSAVDYAIFTMTPEGRVDYWNTGAQRMFGYRPSEILGRHAAILFTPEDRDAGVPTTSAGIYGATGNGSSSAG